MMNIELIVQIVIYGFILFLVYWGFEIYRKNSLLKNIPGPLPIPFVGVKLPTNIFEIRTFFDGLVSKYGRLFKFYLGPNLTIGAADADFLELLLKSTEHITKSSLYSLLSPLLLDGLVMSSGEKWKQRRKLTNPSFHLSVLKEFFHEFKRSSNTLVKVLEKESDKGTYFDAFDYFSKFSFDIVADDIGTAKFSSGRRETTLEYFYNVLETTLGIKLNVLEGENVEMIDAANTVLRIAFLRNFSLWKRFDIVFRLFGPEYNDHVKSLEIVHNSVMKIIETKRKQYSNENYTPNVEETNNDNIDIKKRAILVDALMLHTDLTNDDILEELTNFIIAGYETTATLMSFVSYYAANNPHIQERLYEEIKSITNDGTEELTLGKIQELKYLDQVIKETLRLNPPGPIIERQLQRDAKLGDTVFPKGTVISILIYWLHTNPEYYPDPWKFDPERFSAENEAKRHPYAYIPFSAGPRNCIGQKYSILEIKTMLATLFMGFKILPQPGSKLEIGVAGLMRTKNGFPIKLARRT